MTKIPSTTTRNLPLTSRFRAWSNRQSTFWKVVLLLMIGIASLLGLEKVYPTVPDDSFLKEIVVSAIGAVVTVFTALAAATWALAGEIAKRREIKALEESERESWRNRFISTGRLKIPGIVIVSSANDNSQWTDRKSICFNDMTDQARQEERYKTASAEILDGEVKRAKLSNISLHNGDCVDLRFAKIGISHDPVTRRRTPLISLTPARATYFDFLSSSANLDTPVASHGGRTLREIANIPSPQEVQDVSQFPFMAKLGSVTLVQTSDDRLVLGVRGKTMIAGQTNTDRREAVHFAAEGVIPEDLDLNGRICPLETSRRALWEELYLGGESQRIGAITKIAWTGFFIDQQRLQPCFSFLAQTDLTFDELKTGASAAKDSWENSNLLCLPFTIESLELRKLILGKHPDLHLASNHAAAGLWFALVYQHGFVKLRDELSRPIAS